MCPAPCQPQLYTPDSHFCKGFYHVHHTSRQGPDFGLWSSRLHRSHLCGTRQPQPDADHRYRPGRPTDDHHRCGQLARRRARRAGARADATFSGARRAVQDRDLVRPHQRWRLQQTAFHAQRRQWRIHLRRPDPGHRCLGQVPRAAVGNRIHGPRRIGLRHLRRLFLPQ